MPFTLSHPIAVLPLHGLARARLPLAALVIGSMIPDVAYFIALEPTGTLGHTPQGIFLQGLPCGAVLYLIWVMLLREPIMQCLPRSIRLRWSAPSVTLTWSHSALVCVALILGAATHIVWDSFTHFDGWAVSSMPWMKTRIGPLPLYKWHQYGGGVLGAMGMVVWGAVTMKKRPVIAHTLPAVAPWRKLLVWGWVASCAACVAMYSVDRVTGGSLHVCVVRGVIGAITGAFLGCTSYAMVWQARRWQTRRCARVSEDHPP